MGPSIIQPAFTTPDPEETWLTSLLQLPEAGPLPAPSLTESTESDFVVTISIKRWRSSQPLSSLRLPDPSAAFGTRLPWLPSPRGVFDEPGHTETDEIESILSDLLPDGDLDLNHRCSEPLPAPTAPMLPSGLECVGGSDKPTLGQADPLATQVLVELLPSGVPGVSCFAEFGGVQVPPVKKRRKQVPVPPEKRDDACGHATPFTPSPASLKRLPVLTLTPRP